MIPKYYTDMYILPILNISDFKRMMDIPVWFMQPVLTYQHSHSILHRANTTLFESSAIVIT